MPPSKLPAQIHETFCPRCDGRVEYARFGASFYEYGSFVEISTGTVVRVDLDAVLSQKLDPQRLFADMAESLYESQSANSGAPARDPDRSTDGIPALRSD